MTQRGSAIVIGGGLIGCFSAYYLARAGCRVVLLERTHIGSGASSGNCGFVCPSHVLPLAAPGVMIHTLRRMISRDPPVVIRWSAIPGMVSWLWRFAGCCRIEPMMSAARGRHALLASSMELYRHMRVEEALDCEWQDHGLLMVHRSPRTFDEYGATATLLEREFDLKVVPYAADDLCALEPSLQPGLAGGWLFPGDAHVRPKKLLSGLGRLLIGLGVDIQEGVEVRSLQITRNSLKSVETSKGSIPADVAVIATGAETPHFAKSLRCRIPVRPAKGYSLTISTGAWAPRIPMIFEQHHVAVTPLHDALRIGSTMEFAGYDRSLNARRIALLMKSTQAHLIDVPDSPKIEAWAGWRPMTYDGLPCIDRAPIASNIVVATGNGMIGVASAPASGKLAAELAVEAVTHIDPRPYSLSRF